MFASNYANAKAVLRPFSDPGDRMAIVGRSRQAALVGVPVMFFAIAGSLTAIASYRGACADGNLRPSCGLFAFGSCCTALWRNGDNTLMWIVKHKDAEEHGTVPMPAQENRSF